MLSTKVDSRTLARVRALARREGIQPSQVLRDALVNLLDDPGAYGAGYRSGRMEGYRETRMRLAASADGREGAPALQGPPKR